MFGKLLTDRWLYLLICVACLLVFAPVVFFDFQSGWDDGWAVKNSYTILGFTPTNLKYVFTNFHYGQYSPISQVIYMGIYSVFGFNPAVFHLYPLLLHIANSCLVLLFIRRISSKFACIDTARKVAFLTALLFAIHPLQVESVAWISASKIPLYTLFTLLAMITYIKYVETGKIRYYTGVYVLFICSYGCKEQTIVFPFILALLDIILSRSALVFGEKTGFQTAGRQSWGFLLLEKLPFLLFALFAGLLMYVHQNETAKEVWTGYPFSQRLVFACYSLADYFGKTVFPVNLLYLYPFPMKPGQELPVHFLIYPVLVLGLLAFLIKAIKRTHWQAVFGLLFFLINLILVLHVIAMSRAAIVADRYVTSTLPPWGCFSWHHGIV